jgi:hypothetical protein
MNLDQWAIQWSIPHAALADLRQRMGLLGTVDATQKPGESEAGVQSRIRLEASQKGMRVWRNNVGALLDDRGVPVRYGLANDSAKVNAVIKSGDLIGIRPVQIGVQHLGTTIGQFVSREVKEQGWRYSGTPREIAQQNWVLLVNSLGGDAAFATSVGTL